MPTTPAAAPPCPDAAAANAAIRALVARVGGRPWTAAELAELERLRGAWLAVSAVPLGSDAPDFWVPH